MRTFSLAPYSMKLVLLLTREEAARAASKSDLGTYPPESAGTCWRAGNTVYVAVHDGDLATLVHELGHAAVRVMSYIGHTVEPGTDEPFCYLLDSMYSRCAPHISPASAPSP
jgi:hypothetical protein